MSEYLKSLMSALETPKMDFHHEILGANGWPAVPPEVPRVGRDAAKNAPQEYAVLAKGIAYTDVFAMGHPDLAKRLCYVKAEAFGRFLAKVAAKGLIRGIIDEVYYRHLPVWDLTTRAMIYAPVQLNWDILRSHVVDPNYITLDDMNHAFEANVFMRVTHDGLSYDWTDLGVTEERYAEKQPDGTVKTGTRIKVDGVEV